MKKILLSFLLLLIASLACYAQSRYLLHGIVETEQGAPIEAAAVSIKENNTIWAYTDKNGGFRLNVPKGKYTVVVSFIGYKTLETPVEIGGNTKVKYRMIEDSESLNGVMIVEKSNAQLLKESALSVNALNLRPIISSAHNLNAIVNKTTGVKVRESGGVGSDFELSINGMSGNSVRYFIDGVPLSSKGSGVNLSNLPVNIIGSSAI